MPVNPGFLSAPEVVGYGRQAGATGPIATLATYTTETRGGAFFAFGNILCTKYTSGNINLVISYTSDDGTKQTNVAFEGHFTSGYGTNVSGTGPFEGQGLLLRAAGNTAITIGVAGTFVATFNAEGIILQVN